MKNNNYYDVAVIGGGASGFASAITSAQKGAKTILLEGNKRTGKKICVTGNGQGNIANSNLSPENYNNIFALNVFNKIPLKTLKEFFDKAGIEIIEKENGRIYPLSLQASSVVDNLRLTLKELNVTEKCDFTVNKIDKKDDLFYIYSINNEKIVSKAVIIACGGKAYPHLSCGGGYELLTKFGHKITKLLPALVQLKTQKEPVRFLTGVKIENANVQLYCDKKLIKQVTNDIIFTSYGVSGLAVFEISGKAVKMLDSGNNVNIVIDMLPKYNLDKIIDTLNKRKKVLKLRTVENFLTGFINKQIAKSILEKVNIKSITLVNDITDVDIKNIAKEIKFFKLNVTASLNFDNAQVTQGGIELKDFDENLMSKLCENLYACGEILDIDGDCGGYNLMWAFCSGILCGKNAIKKDIYII